MNKEQVEGLLHLKKLAEQKKSVICPGLRVWNQREPAGFILNLPGAIIAQMLESGLFIYEKEKKEERKP